jgi:ribosome-associated protein
MDLRQLQRTIVDALEDVKAQDIRVYDTTKLSELFDRVSSPQVAVTAKQNL